MRVRHRTGLLTERSKRKSRDMDIKVREPFMIDNSAEWFYLSIVTLVGWLSRMQSLSVRSVPSAARV